MTWLAWRLQRLNIFVFAGLSAAFAAALVLNRQQLTSYLAGNDIGCSAGESGSCDSLLAYVEGVGRFDLVWPYVLIAIPALVGLFWAAPLFAREVETGTHRLVLTQSVSRQRWLSSKLGLALAAALSITALATAVHYWWAAPGRTTRFSPDLLFQEVFAAQGIMPLAYTAFAVALGATAGLLVQRVVPAMGITLGAYAATFTATTLGREFYMTPVQQRVAGGEEGLAVPESAFVLENGSIGTNGQLLPKFSFSCDSGVGVDAAAIQEDCLARTSFRGPAVSGSYVDYQPAERLWTFQIIEASILLTLAVILVAVAVFWVRKRLR